MHQMRRNYPKTNLYDDSTYCLIIEPNNGAHMNSGEISHVLGIDMIYINNVTCLKELFSLSHLRAP